METSPAPGAVAASVEVPPPAAADDESARSSGTSGTRSEPLLSPPTAKGNRSRRAIKEAARRILQKDGYVNARVVDIAKEAGFSNGAFYKYFRDKHDLMVELLRDLLAEAYETVHTPWSEVDPLKSVRLTTAKYLVFFNENRDLFRVLFEVAQTDVEVESMWAEVRSHAIARLERMIVRGRQIGLIREEVDSQLAATLLVAMTDYYAYLWFILGRVPDRSIDDVAHMVTRVWARGIYGVLLDDISWGMPNLDPNA